MSDESIKSSKRVLEPNERISEVLFGLIMVLTFTGSLSVAEAGREDVRTMLIGALGCNLAWGIIDGVLYLMGCLAEKGRDLMTFRAVRKATDPQKAQRLIADALPPVVASILEPAELETMRQRLKQLPEPPARARLRKDDWLGALGVFLLVFLSTFPVVIPFIFMHNAGPALRVSNAIAIVMLFLTGYAFGRITGRHPWLIGIRDGRARGHSRGHHHGAGRMKHDATTCLHCDGGRSSRAPTRCAQTTTNAPPATATNTRRRRRADGRESLVLLRLRLHLPRARRAANTCSPPSRRTAAGCISKRATTTKRSTPARRGSATISAAAKSWRGSSRRCSAACSATPPASRRATKAR